MDYSEKYENLNPKLSANIFSKLTFSWLLPLFWYGRKNDLKEKDLYNVLPENRSEILGEKMERLWNEETLNAKKNDRKPNFFNVTLKMFFWSTFYYMLYMAAIHLVLRQILPISLARYIKHFDADSNSTISEGYMYAAVFSICTFLTGFIYQSALLKLQECAMRCRIATSALIYKKLTRLSSSSSGQINEGFIINLLTDDVIRCQLFFEFIHYTWIGLIVTIEVIYLTWKQIGIPAVVGLIALVLQTLPIQAIVGKLMYHLRLKAAARNDRRLFLINEIINGIRVIKLYVWEKPFEKFVFLARKLEIDTLITISFLNSFNWALYEFIPRTVSFFITLHYVLLNGYMMSSDEIFSTQYFFRSIQIMVTFNLPRIVKYTSETKIASKRIQEFLLFDEKENVVKRLPKTYKRISISVDGVNASWKNNLEMSTLTNINTKIFNEKLYAIVGPPGAGKSSFLKLILGELHPSTGEVLTYGKISYASQVPWIFTGSVKNNILLGEPYDEQRYSEVTKACCLVEDFAQLPYGDKTNLGESGVALSGGQVARINLARAVYRNADIYLFDNSLSAVDVQVGNKLFRDCFKRLLIGKTRILVTHNVKYLNEVDYIFLFNEGKIQYQGTFDNFKKDQCFKDLDMYQEATNFSKKEKNISEDINNVEDFSKISDLRKAKNNLCEDASKFEEHGANGEIDMYLFWKYFKSSGSYFLLFASLLCFILSQFFLSSSDFWVSYLTEHHKRPFIGSCGYVANNQTNLAFSKVITVNNYNNRTNNTFINCMNDSNNNFHISTSLYIYGFLVMGCVAMTVVKNIVFYKVCLEASKNIHNNMLVRLLHAPLQFFNSNPAGRILNRFSKDTKTVDEFFSTAMLQVIQYSLMFIGMMIQALIINWWLIFPTIVTVYIWLTLQKVYFATARDITRLEGKTKSPVLSYANTSLSGLETIRSCESEAVVCKEFDTLQDQHTSASYLGLATMTAFCFWIEVVSASFMTISIFSFLLFDNIPASTVGLAVSLIATITVNTQHLMRQCTEAMIYFISVERMFQYTELSQEESLKSKNDQKPPNSWPSKGCIRFDHLYLNYTNNTKPVLKNINFEIKAGEKIGIVGRTGAGKSSIVAALFRLAEIDGSLYIDDEDVKNFSLHDLRTKISIVPQESILFSATLRENIDPYHEVDDATIWSALNDVKLKSIFTSLDESLDKKNFSAGQLQLLSLARAIIKNNKILVLDEATANVDQTTDSLVQGIIKSKFNNCTVITIAHRLNTIIDSDKVLVVNGGEIVEYDHPYILLQKESGYFVKQVAECGQSMYEHLKRIAEAAWEKNYTSIKHALEIETEITRL